MGDAVTQAESMNTRDVTQTMTERVGKRELMGNTLSRWKQLKLSLSIDFEGYCYYFVVVLCSFLLENEDILKEI